MGSSKEIQMLHCLGKHGSYSFYKSIRIGERVLTLARQFPVRIYPDTTILSIAEVQLLWTDRNESLCSLKLYFLPENTPDGRLEHHGEDEVIALQDPVIIRASDLASWLVVENDWDWGFLTPSTGVNKAPTSKLSKAFASEKYAKQDKEKDGFYSTDYESKVVVLNYERYVRLRSMLKRLEGTPDLANWLTNPTVLALGGLPVGPNCRVVFAKEVFDYPELEDHELLCNHMAPKLKGKQKRRKRKRNPSLGSDSNASESSSNGSSGSYKAARRSVNGVSKDRNDPFKFDANELVKLYAQGILTSADFKDGSFKPSSAAMKKITDRYIAENMRMGNNGRTGSDSSRQYSALGGRTLAAPSRKIKGERGMLGPDLSELAQKLEKSNALQILPVRPSVIQKQDAFQEDFLRKKRIKTETSLGFNGEISARLMQMKQETESSGRYSGPFSLSTRSVYGNPGVRPNVSRPEKAFGSELQRTGAAAKDMQKPKPGKPTGIAAAEMDKEKVRPPRFSTPCMYVPTRSLKIYTDPVKDRKRGVPIHSSEHLEARVETATPEAIAKARRHHFEAQPERPKQDLLDLSEKEEEAAKNMYHSLADLPPPNAVNQLGLRLTSEVTLFPSNLLSGVVGAGAKEPKVPKTGKVASAQSGGSTSGRGVKASKWEHKIIPESHAQHNLQSSIAMSGSQKNMFAADPRHELLTASTPGSSKQQSHLSSRLMKKPESSQSSSTKESSSGPASSSAPKPSSHGQHGRDKNRESLLQLNPGAHLGQRGIPPVMFPKMDPNYLNLFSHMFMPPSGMGGLGFPGMLGLPPGALEQIQLYQELIQKGLVPQFPTGWIPDNAHDRGQK